MRLFIYGLAVSVAILFQGCVEDSSSQSVTQRSVAPYGSNPLYYQQWYFHKDDNFYAAYSIDPDANIHPWPTTEYAGRGVKIAIIDDALDIYHEDIKDGVIATYDAESGTSNVLPRNGEENHGTEVTGVAAATSNSLGISGIAPGAQIYFIRIPFNSSLTESMIIDAFQKAKDWGADVINCSWGSGDVSAPVAAAIRDVAINGRGGKGTIVVFAAGNGGDDGVGDPIGNDESGIEEVIAVGATNIFNERTRYSNYGPELDIMAPGGEYMGIATLDRTGSAGDDPGNYLTYNANNAFGGTSASAPIVTGVSALLLEADSNLTREQLVNLLESYADKIDFAQCSYDVNGHSDYCGYGKVNVLRVIQAL
ncbi:calcium-dependent protease precursor [Hydrogenimonas sp.]|nr:calcium-dependent protease precursor [Hydrogenimonas sp.]